MRCRCRRARCTAGRLPPRRLPRAHNSRPDMVSGKIRAGSGRSPDSKSGRPRRTIAPNRPPRFPRPRCRRAPAGWWSFARRSDWPRTGHPPRKHFLDRHSRAPRARISQHPNSLRPASRTKRTARTQWSCSASSKLPRAFKTAICTARRRPPERTQSCRPLGRLHRLARGSRCHTRTCPPQRGRARSSSAAPRCARP
jgi:hypothetical protein